MSKPNMDPIMEMINYFGTDASTPPPELLLEVFKQISPVLDLPAKIKLKNMEVKRESWWDKRNVVCFCFPWNNHPSYIVYEGEKSIVSPDATYPCRVIWDLGSTYFIWLDEIQYAIASHEDIIIDE